MLAAEAERSAGGCAGDGHEVLQRIRDGPVQSSIGVQPQVGGAAAGMPQIGVL